MTSALYDDLQACEAVRPRSVRGFALCLIAGAAVGVVGHMALAKADQRYVDGERQMGRMPSHVQERDDADLLWLAFRRSVGLAWSGGDLTSFIAGWDAAKRQYPAQP